MHRRTSTSECWHCLIILDVIRQFGSVGLLLKIGAEDISLIPESGHDWGCGSVWTFASVYPERCVAVAGLTVPYRTVELGLEELLRTVDRDLYPKDQYPEGQWNYQRFYEESFDKATKWFDSDIGSVMRLLYSKGDPAGYKQPSFTATVTTQGGWFGGIEKPDPNWKHMPIDKTVLDEEMYSDLVQAMEETSFWGADAWYMNHKRNRAYALAKSKNEGRLHMPVLFIGAKFDVVCMTAHGGLNDRMRQLCTDLTECTIDAGHWVAEEKPEETNAAIARWLMESCKSYWPGYWTSPHVTIKSSL